MKQFKKWQNSWTNSLKILVLLINGYLGQIKYFVCQWWATFQLWVPFKAHFPGQSLISIRICWAKKGSIWCEQDLDWDSTVTCFCRLGQNLSRCNFPTEKYRSEQNSKFQAKVGNSSNDWDCADGLQLSAVLLLFIRCNCNSAHLIKTRCHFATKWAQK